MNSQIWELLSQWDKMLYAAGWIMVAVAAIGVFIALYLVITRGK